EKKHLQEGSCAIRRLAAVAQTQLGRESSGVYGKHDEVLMEQELSTPGSTNTQVRRSDDVISGVDQKCREVCFGFKSEITRKCSDLTCDLRLFKEQHTAFISEAEEEGHACSL
ncbi:hypothetical protein DNTS_029631, partial [Danionella cerebrum]